MTSERHSSFSIIYPTERSSSPSSVVPTSDNEDDGAVRTLDDAEHALHHQKSRFEKLEERYEVTRLHNVALAQRIEELERERVSNAERHRKETDRLTKEIEEFDEVCSECDVWKQRHAVAEDEIKLLVNVVEHERENVRRGSERCERDLGPIRSSAVPGSTVTWRRHDKWYDDEPVYIKVSYKVHLLSCWRSLEERYSLDVQIQDVLYRVSKKVIERLAPYFLKSYDVAAGETEDNAIEPEGVTAFDMDSLLSVLHAS